MANGVPVIASNVGGVPEIIEDGVSGLLFNYRIKGALADLIEKIYSNKDFSLKIAKAGERKALEYFHVQNTARNYENLYLKLLASASY